MTMCSRFTITDDGDEAVSIKLDGEELITPNHDTDGWAGMSRIIELVEKIAAALDIRVQNDQDIV